MYVKTKLFETSLNPAKWQISPNIELSLEHVWENLLEEADFFSLMDRRRLFKKSEIIMGGVNPIVLTIRWVW